MLLHKYQHKSVYLCRCTSRELSCDGGKVGIDELYFTNKLVGLSKQVLKEEDFPVRCEKLRRN
jgi:hypothetical protein